MRVRKLELHEFRNYESLVLEFDPRLNLILGANAQGKTNLVEAVRLCSSGRSFRTRREEELIRFGQDIARVKLDFVYGENYGRTASRDAAKDDDSVDELFLGEEGTIEIALSKNAKALKVDGKKLKKSSELLSSFYTVIFTPEDLRMVKDGPEKRRAFMDQELCQLKRSYHAELNEFRRSLLQRNTLLKDFGNYGVKGLIEAGIEVWDEKLSRSGVRLMRERALFMERLSEISKNIHFAVTEGREELYSSYEPNLKFFSVLKSDSGMISEYMALLRENYEKDSVLKTTSIGPQRDDISLKVNDIDIRKYGSQGQQRTTALSLKLSELDLIREEAGEEAVLLLDDVLSELDVKRQLFLIKSLSGRQVLITAAELSAELLGELPEGRIIRVAGGSVETDGKYF